jgi:MFS family permease
VPPRWWPAGLAWALFALFLLVLAGLPWLDRLIRQAGRADLAPLTAFAIPPTLAGLTASLVGVVLALRRPRHPVGWLLLALSLCQAMSGAAAGYVPYGLVVRPGALPAAHLVARLYPTVTDAGFAALGFVLLLTPTGSPPSSRWRWWAWGSAGAMLVVLVAATVAPGSLDPDALVAGGPQEFRAFGGALRLANQAAQAVAILTILAGTVSLVVRFRHARGVERQQLQWVALAAALIGVAMAAMAVLIAAGQVGLAEWVAVLCLAVLPLAIGAAILRYRLYDLDRIISRTVAYGLLTLLLGGGYAVVVLGLGQLLGRRSPSLVVAGATLAVAALFQPARRRVQAVVDRRFNRRRYDAARTIQAFSARLRQQVDLDALTGELLAVVDQTMQPTQAWLWLRPSHAAASATGGGPVAHQ